MHALLYDRVYYYMVACTTTWSRALLHERMHYYMIAYIARHALFAPSSLAAVHARMRALPRLYRKLWHVVDFEGMRLHR